MISGPRYKGEEGNEKGEGREGMGGWKREGTGRTPNLNSVVVPRSAIAYLNGAMRHLKIVGTTLIKLPGKGGIFEKIF